MNFNSILILFLFVFLLLWLIFSYELSDFKYVFNLSVSHFICNYSTFCDSDRVINKLYFNIYFILLFINTDPSVFYPFILSSDFLTKIGKI